MIGPGKYDTEAMKLLRKLKADGILLIVIGGPKGQGCSVKLSPDLAKEAPAILEQIASSLRADIKKAGLS